MGRARIWVCSMVCLASGLAVWAKPQSDPRHLLRQWSQLQREGQHQAAQALLEHLNECYADSVSVLVTLARQHWQSGQPDNALALIEVALRVEPTCMDAYMARAEILRRQNRLTEAMQSLETGLRLAPQHELADRMAGLLRLMQGQWEAAIVHFTRYVNQTDDQDADVYCWRGLAWLRSGRPAHAEQDFARALQLVPDLSEILLYRGQALESQGQLDKAAQLYARYLISNPQDAQARLAYVGLLQRLRRLSETSEHLRTLLQQSDQREVLQTVYQTARRLRQYHLALLALERLIALDPDNAQLWFQKAIVLDNLQRKSETLTALDECEKRLEKSRRPGAVAPLSVVVNGFRADVYCQLGQLEAALKCLDKAIEQNPGYLYGYFRRADVYWRMGKVQAALAELDAALQNHQEYELFYFKKAEILRAQGKWTEALRQLDKAVQVAPRNSFASTQRGGLLLLLGRWDEAAQELARVREEQSDTQHPSTAAYARALVAALQGQWQQAEQIAEDHLAEMPTDSLSAYNLACAWALFADIRVRKFGASPHDPAVRIYKERALVLLEKTFQLGYIDRWHTVHDPDFFTLHREPAFWHIVGTKQPWTQP